MSDFSSGAIHRLVVGPPCRGRSSITGFSFRTPNSGQYQELSTRRRAAVGSDRVLTEPPLES